MKKLIILLALVVIIFGISEIKTSFAADLTGVWSGDDGGKYYLRQIGNEIWWFGESSPTEPGWSNVAHGTIKNNVIVLKWSDVPKGGTSGNGNLKLKVENQNKLTIFVNDGGFSGTVLTRTPQ